MAKLIDISGQKFGLLTAKAYDSNTGTWLCECDCGKTLK